MAATAGPGAKAVDPEQNLQNKYSIRRTVIEHERYHLQFNEANYINKFHHHLITYPLTEEGRLGTTDDFTTSFLHFPFFSVLFALFSTASGIWRTPGLSIPRCCLLTSFSVCPCLLPPFTVPCKMVLARPDERETYLPVHVLERLNQTQITVLSAVPHIF